MKFNIEAPKEDIKTLLVEKIDNLNKPKGSLGRLEELALHYLLRSLTLAICSSEETTALNAKAYRPLPAM